MASLGLPPRRPRGTSPVLSLRDLNRTLLERQLLLRRRARPVAVTLEHLVGMQAQTPKSPYLALWNRLHRFRPAALETMVASGEAVRIVLMRGTIHLVTARDAGAMRTIVQPVLDRALQGSYGRALDGVDLAEVARAGHALLGERPRTLDEIGRALQPRWPRCAPNALAQAVRAAIPLAQIPPRGLWSKGGASVYARADTWVPSSARRALSIDDLVLRYLAAFGPSTIADAQSWSGLARLREVFDRLRDRLRVCRHEDGGELFDVPDGVLASGETPAPPRFLPDYDNLLLAHADRRRVIPAPYGRSMGIGAPAVLVDGFVSARWRVHREGRRVALAIEPLRAFSGAERRAVADEGARVLAFLHPNAGGYDVRIDRRA